MLNSLRSAAGTWIVKLLLVILVMSFAVWGISGQISHGFGGSSVVTAGGTTVSAQEYRLAYDRQLNVLGQRFGQRLTREQATALGVDDQVVGQIVAGAVLDEQARQMRLGLSKDRIASLTAEDPAFHGPDGRFDRQQFDHVLRQIGMRPEDYLTNRSQVAIRQQIVEAVSDGLHVPDTFLHAVALYRGEDRTAEYLVAPKSLVEPIDPPAESVLSSWFTDHKADYAAPEYRKISYVKLEPEDIADESAITDEQVKADYEKNKARYTTPETRTIEQLVFASTADADTASASLKSGATFDSAVTGAGKTTKDVQLGTFSKDRMPDKAVADAAFALGVNQVSDVVAGAFGPVILRVTAITPEVIKTLAEVTPQIRKDLAVSEAARILLDAHDQYEDARAAGETLKEAAEKLKLKVVTIDAIDRAAQRPDGSIVKDVPSSEDVLNAAFATEVNIENPAVPIGSNGYVYFQVDAVTPARERPLDEVRAKVVADWTKAETAKRLADKGAELLKRIKDGTTLDAIATELKLDKQTKRGLKRQADDGDFGKEGVAAVFGVAEGGSGMFAAPGGDAQILFKVTEVVEPAASGADTVAAQDKTSFQSGLADDLLDQLVARLQTDYEVRIDRAAITRALAF